VLDPVESMVCAEIHEAMDRVKARTSMDSRSMARN